MGANRTTTTDHFTAAQAARLSGLSIAMVNYLCREKLVEPSATKNRGHGRQRHYLFGDVVALRLVARLSEAGVSALRLKKALSKLKVLHPDITLTSLPASHIITDGREIYLRKPGESFQQLLDGQFTFAFVVELKRIQRDVIVRLGMKKPETQRKATRYA